MKGDAEDPYELVLPGWAADLVLAREGVSVQEYASEFFAPWVVRVVVLRGKGAWEMGKEDGLDEAERAIRSALETVQGRGVAGLMELPGELGRALGRAQRRAREGGE